MDTIESVHSRKLYIVLDRGRALSKNSCFFYSQLKCQKSNLCNGAGRCLDDRDELDGFKCECVHNYYGKYCQYEKYCKDYKYFDMKRIQIRADREKVHPQKSLRPINSICGIFETTF